MKIVPASHQMHQQACDTRFARLDLIRGLAILAGVLLHATMAYQSTTISVPLWPVHEIRGSWICDVIFWGIHAIRLPLFFFLSGFFTEHLFQTRGWRAFLQHRLRRLVVPYAVSLVTILPATFLVWNLGRFIAGNCTFDDPLSLLVTSDPGQRPMSLFNPAHLWFLLDLIIMSFSYVIIRNEFSSNDAEVPPVIGILRPVWTPALLAIPSTMLLWGQTSPVTEVHDSFLPNAPRLLYFSLYYAVGISMFRRFTTFCDALQRPAWHLMISAAGIGGVLMTFHAEVIGTSGLWNRLCFSLSVSVAAWFFLFGVMGIAIQERCRSGHHAMSRFLADASYWIYLVHLPIVGLAQIALMPLDWRPEAKMLCVFTAAAAVSFGSYFAFVRYTAIGECLHGRRTRLKATDSISLAPPDLA